YLEIFKEREEQGNPLSSECISAFNDYLDTSKNTRSSIRKTFTARLELWANPVIDAATSTNDFDLRDLRKKAMSIYVAITPDDLDRLAPITNLFFQQVIDLNIRELPDYENPDSEYKHQVLMLMDEFTSLGRLNSLFKGVSFIAGFGLRLLPIIQSPSQLRDQKLYGVEGANTFMENHALRIVFPPKDHKIAEEISNTLGFETVKSRSRSKQLSGSGGRSYSESDQRRALLLPQEITQLGARKALIILENCPPIKAVKIRYYEDPVFTQRLLDPPGVPEVTIKERQSGTVIDIAARTVTRAVTPEDVANIENMTLDDFSCEFSGIAIPTDNENLTDEELEAMANDFLNKITGEAA
ncbi:type IV secretory system conjugative DNA transfer family protein, partial [Thiolapillus sp.]